MDQVVTRLLVLKFHEALQWYVAPSCNFIVCNVVMLQMLHCDVNALFPPSMTFKFLPCLPVALDTCPHYFFISETKGLAFKSPQNVQKYFTRLNSRP